MTHMHPSVCVPVLPCSTRVVQEFHTTISGLVLDNSGVAMLGVRTEVTNAGTNKTTMSTTEAAGAFTMAVLRPGNYNLTATAVGFKTQVQEKLLLEIAEVFDTNLDVGTTKEGVEVTVETALMETQRASSATAVRTQQIAELPLNARTFMLDTMAPGVTFNRVAFWQRQKKPGGCI